MKIETKFNLDQEVFYMSSNRVISERISDINITTGFEPVNKKDMGQYLEIEYGFVREHTNTEYIAEQFLFATKKDLLNSL